MVFVTRRPRGVYGTNRIGATFGGGDGDFIHIGNIRCQFRNDRNINCSFYCADYFPNELRVLAHVHAITFRMRARQI